jgi:hypothetical protein
MLEICLLGYVVSGAFLPRAYFDLWFQLVASAALLKILYKKEISVSMAEQVETPAATDLVEAPAG